MVDIRLDIDDGIDRQDLTRLRKRFLTVNHDRLQRANLILSSRQQLVLRLLPLLLHVNIRYCQVLFRVQRLSASVAMSLLLI